MSAELVNVNMSPHVQFGLQLGQGFVRDKTEVS